MFWFIKQYFIRKRRLRGRMKDMLQDYTCLAALLLIAVIVIGVVLGLGLAHAEEDPEVYLSEPRPTVTELWQTIHPDKDATITVWFEHPDPMEWGDDISFYCTFEGCHRDNFTYTWQYSNSTYWTNFGSKPRKNTTYSDMLAGQHIRLEVEWK